MTNVSNAFGPTVPGDAFFVLYQDSFDPANPLTNCVVLDDNSAGDSRPQITRNLSAGTTYILVIVSLVGDTGAFSNQIALTTVSSAPSGEGPSLLEGVLRWLESILAGVRNTAQAITSSRGQSLTAAMST
jgi:hypothetical protein